MNPDIIKSENQHLISRQFLIRKGINEKTINTGIEKFLDGKSFQWNCLPMQNGPEVYLNFNSLPAQIRKAIESNKESSNVFKKLPLRGNYVMDLMLAYKNGEKDFQKEFSQIENEDLRNKYARKYAVMLQCMNIYLELGCKWGLYQKIYRCLLEIGVDFYKNPDSFRLALKGFLNADNFAESILHKAIGKPNNSVKKLSDWHVLKITGLLGQGHSKTEIHQILKKESPPEKVSYSSICRAVNTRMKNITAEKRYGYHFFKKHLEPYILRQKPGFKLQVVEADATRFQIPYVNKKGKMKFLKLYAIIDVFSSMILGFSLREEETSEMAIDAFFMMFDFHHYLPSCIIVDRSSAHTSNRFSRFKTETNRLYGTLWREHLPDYPNAKGTIENFFRNFHIQIARRYFDYIGLSITARSDDHRINRDKVKYIVKNKSHLRTKYELIQFAGRLISEWNQHITKDKSPLQKHESGKTLNAKPINQEGIARLCWDHAHRKVTRSKIDFSNHEYAIEDNENRLIWNGESVDVFFHPKVEDYVFLFKGDTFIEKARKKIRYNDDDGSKFGQIKKNKAFRQYAKQQYSINQKDLKKAEMDDPMLSLYYEESKAGLNDQFSNFINQEYGMEDVMENDKLAEIGNGPKPNLDGY